jgi:hypothetical protein
MTYRAAMLWATAMALMRVSHLRVSQSALRQLRAAKLWFHRWLALESHLLHSQLCQASGILIVDSHSAMMCGLFGWRRNPFTLWMEACSQEAGVCFSVVEDAGCSSFGLLRFVFGF